MKTEMMRKILSAILCLAMLMAYIPQYADVAHAEEPAPVETAVEEETSARQIIINPIYADLVTEADIADAQSVHAAEADEECPYFSNDDEAAAYVRKMMKARVDDFSFKTNYHPGRDEEYILNLAFTHTGVLDEGDSLKCCWIWCSYGVNKRNADTFEDEGRIWDEHEYSFGYTDTEQQSLAVNSRISEILNSLNLKNKSDYEKVRAIYEYITSNVRYGYGESYLTSHSPYSALFCGEAVCEGYALLFYRMALQAGLDSRLVTSDSHAWNIVRVGEVYYFVDATWDAGIKDFTYFLKSDFMDHFICRDDIELCRSYPMAQHDFDPDAEPEHADSNYEFMPSELVFKIEGENAELVRGRGDFVDLVIPSHYQGYPVTEIGAWAFYEDRNLKTVVLPNTVKAIYTNAFTNCSSLEKIEIPEGLERIADRAFRGCPNLVSITLPKSFKTLDDYALSGSSLAEVIFLGESVEFGQGAFGASNIGRLVIPEGVTEIPDGALDGCNYLYEITLPSTLKSIGVRAFGDIPLLSHVYFRGTQTQWKKITVGEQNNALLSAQIHYNVTERQEPIASGFLGENNCATWTVDQSGVMTISGSGPVNPPEGLGMWDMPEEWFNIRLLVTDIQFDKRITEFGYGVYFFDLLETLTIPGNLKKAGEYYTCNSLRNVIIEDGVEEIRFDSCNKLEKIVLPDSVRYFSCERCKQLREVVVSKNAEDCYRAFEECYALKKVKLNNGLPMISYMMFSGSGIEEISLPNSVEYIDIEAFSYCTQLKRITLPDKMNAIYTAAFIGSGLRSVSIPASVSNIGRRAFALCPDLHTVIFNGNAPEYFGEEAFLEDTVTVFYDGTKSGWSSYVGQQMGGKVTWVNSRAVMRLPASLTTIEENAFMGVHAESIVIPENVQTISAGAFQNCKQLKGLHFEGNPSQIADNILTGCSNVTIYAQKGSTAAKWATAHSIPVIYT